MVSNNNYVRLNEKKIYCLLTKAIPYAAHKTFFTVSLFCSLKLFLGDKSVLPFCGLQIIFWFFFSN